MSENKSQTGSSKRHNLDNNERPRKQARSTTPAPQSITMTARQIMDLHAHAVNSLNILATVALAQSNNAITIPVPQQATPLPRHIMPPVNLTPVNLTPVNPTPTIQMRPYMFTAFRPVRQSANWQSANWPSANWQSANWPSANWQSAANHYDSDTWQRGDPLPDSLPDLCDLYPELRNL